MIPTEIVDHILSYLHSDQDYTSLKSCSVVFPLLVDRHLYSQVTFYISGGTLLYSRCSFDMNDTYVVDPTIFSRTLFDHPHVSKCVRDVRIVLITFRPLVPQHLQMISAILSSLTHIESLMLKGRSRILWPTLGPEFRAAFQNSLQLPSIKKVAISDFDGFPLDMFKDCKTLTNLRLHKLEFFNSGDISTSPYPRLSSLHVDDRPSDWTRVIPWVKDTLHTLSLRAQFRFDFPKLRILIAACSASLVNLELDCGSCYNPYEFTHLDDPQLRLPLLEHVIFRCTIEERVFGTEFDRLNLLVPFLTDIPSISSTSPIRLTLHIDFYHSGSSDTPTPDWSNITNILVLPIFRHPIQLHSHHWEPGVGARIVDSLEQHSGIKKLLVDRKLVLIKGKARHGSKIIITYPDEGP